MVVHRPAALAAVVVLMVNDVHSYKRSLQNDSLVNQSGRLNDEPAITCSTHLSQSLRQQDVPTELARLDCCI